MKKFLMIVTFIFAFTDAKAADAIPTDAKVCVVNVNYGNQDFYSCDGGPKVNLDLVIDINKGPEYPYINLSGQLAKFISLGYKLILNHNNNGISFIFTK